MVPIEHQSSSSRTPQRNSKLDGLLCSNNIPTTKSITTATTGFISCMIVGSSILLLLSNNNPNLFGLWKSSQQANNQGFYHPRSRISGGTTTNNSVRKKKLDFSNDNYSSNKDYNEQCRYYLGESAIPNGGLGLYTTIDIVEGEEAQSMADICIYVADTPSGNHFHTHSWAKDVFIGQFEGFTPRAACEGFATLFNSMPNPISTSKLVSMHHHTNGGLSRYHNPGAGAITHYYGISSQAIRDIPAGSELTIDYGDWPYDNETEEYVAPKRHVDWIRNHGMCIDNIKIGRARVNPEMGRSAFARYNVKKGSRIAPAPIQMFRNRSDFAQQIPEALFINYCFQPDGMDLLLFPYGPGVNLINHASDPNKINVKIEWSNHYMSHNHWLDLPYHQYWEMDYPGGLIIDYIATRDINEGDELFMDYGTQWEQAWKNHTTYWKPLNVEQTNDYTYVEELLKNRNTEPFRTVQEQKRNPYPSNIKTTCWTQNWDRDENTIMDWIKPTGSDWPEGMVYCNILQRYSNNSTKTKNHDISTMNTTTTTTDDEPYYYDVSILFDRMEPDEVDMKKFIDRKVPHSAISFVDKPYMSDLHLPNAFRHPIGLPDHMIPPQWIEQQQKKLQ